MLLFHAISSYQLLYVMILALKLKQESVLLLPDFITEKYPQYLELKKKKIFKDVFLFPYLQIAHVEDQISEQVKKAYETLIPYEIENFEEIYVAGAHFYFTDYLIQNRKKFVFIEDAFGMLDRGNEMYLHLKQEFPVHAQFARERGLFEGENKNVKYILCSMLPQKRHHKKYITLDIYKEFEKLRISSRKKVINFFVKDKIRFQNKNSVLVLTQFFYGLGIMSKEQQIEIYKILYERLLKDFSHIYVKKHPDDKLDYSEIFKGASLINGCFPAELLPYISKGKVDALCTISTTCFAPLRNNYLWSFCVCDFYVEENYEDGYPLIKRLLSSNNVCFKRKEDGHGKYKNG